MTYYQLTGHVFNLLPYLAIFSIFFVKKNLTEYLIILFFTVGSIYLYDYRLFGFISLQQILMTCIALLYFMLHSDIHKDKDILFFKRRYLSIFIFFSIVTILFHLLNFEFKVQGSIVQNELRSVFQIAQLGLMFLSSIVILSVKASIAKRILNYIFFSILLLAIIGLLQELIYLLFNFDIFPMRKDFFNPLFGITDKMYGFVRITVGIGEPKQVAKYLNIGLSCLIFVPSLLYLKKYRVIFSIIFVLAILFTFSTTGYIILFSQIFIFILIKYRRNILILTMSISLLSIISIIVFMKTDFFIDKIEYLVSIGDIPFLENSDTAALKFLLSNPVFILFGVGIGNIVSFAYLYAPLGSQYINNAPYTLRRGIIKNLAEGGIVGTMLINLLFLSYIKKVKDSNIRSFILFMVFYYNFMTVEALNEFIMIFIVLLYTIDRKSETGRFNENTSNNT
ncbi:MAG TPA: hypothetical protein DIC19_05790 [Erysipelotrichaceae bacterium]|nr:hypothetical protein [Erysipelotrichaceae bacterium]